MKKCEFGNFTDNLTKLYEGTNSAIYKIRSGEILKTFTPDYLDFLDKNEANLEKRILSSKGITDVPEIITPTSAGYSRGNFIGFTTKNVEGYNLGQLVSVLPLEFRSDLSWYAALYDSIESPVKRATNIVFPDLCTIENIMVTNGGNIKLIDYDGLQVGQDKSIIISSMLGDQNQYNNHKYCIDDLYTKELDIKSLIMLYFLITFNVNLNFIGKKSIVTGKEITLDDIFDQIGLDDQDIMHKVWKSMQSTGKNEYLGNDVYRISEMYDMDVYRHPTMTNTYIKVLRKK